MLALKQALSLVTIKNVGGWQPSDDRNLEAWYKFQTGITLNGSDVSAWADSSENSFNMEQATASEQPAYSAGALTFDGTDDHLQTSGQMTISGAFTVGIKCDIDDFNNVLLGDNTDSNEMFKITSTTNIRVKTSSTEVVNLPLASGTLGDGYLVITRDASNNMGLWHNGVDQNISATLTGTADIDAIGIRNPDTNAFNGVMYEIQIYDKESTSLTANVNTYLSNL